MAPAARKRVKKPKKKKRPSLLRRTLRFTRRVSMVIALISLLLLFLRFKISWPKRPQRENDIEDTVKKVSEAVQAMSGFTPPPPPPPASVVHTLTKPPPAMMVSSANAAHPLSKPRPSKPPPARGGKTPVRYQTRPPSNVVRGRQTAKGVAAPRDKVRLRSWMRPPPSMRIPRMPAPPPQKVPRPSRGLVRWGVLSRDSGGHALAPGAPRGKHTPRFIGRLGPPGARPSPRQSRAGHKIGPISNRGIPRVTHKHRSRAGHKIGRLLDQAENMFMSDVEVVFTRASFTVTEITKRVRSLLMMFMGMLGEDDMQSVDDVPDVMEVVETWWARGRVGAGSGASWIGASVQKAFYALGRLARSYYMHLPSIPKREAEVRAALAAAKPEAGPVARDMMNKTCDMVQAFGAANIVANTRAKSLTSVAKKSLMSLFQPPRDPIPLPTEPPRGNQETRLALYQGGPKGLNRSTWGRVTVQSPPLRPSRWNAHLWSLRSREPPKTVAKGLAVNNKSTITSKSKRNAAYDFGYYIGFVATLGASVLAKRYLDGLSGGNSPTGGGMQIGQGAGWHGVRT